MKERWIRLIQVGLSSTASTLTQLFDVPVEIDLESCRLGELSALDDVYPALCAATRVQGCGRQAGFLVPETLAVELGSTLAMTPADEGVTADVLDALGEVINLMIGAWGQSPIDAADRLSNDVNDRSIWPVPSAAEHEWEEPVGVVSFAIRFQGTSRRMALIGAQAWLNECSKTTHPSAAGDRSITNGHHGATQALYGARLMGE